MCHPTQAGRLPDDSPLLLPALSWNPGRIHYQHKLEFSLSGLKVEDNSEDPLHTPPKNSTRIADTGVEYHSRSSQASVCFLTCQSARLHWSESLTSGSVKSWKGQERLLRKGWDLDKEWFGPCSRQEGQCKPRGRPGHSSSAGVSHFGPRELQERKLQGFP